MTSKLRTGKKEAGAKFADYFDFSEPLTKLPSHRILAMFRGEKEEVLDLQIQPEPVAPGPAVTPAPLGSFELQIMNRFQLSDRGRPADRWLIDTVRWAWRTKIQVHLNIDLRMKLWTAAEQEAVRVFASNLRDLLLAAPAGARATMGLDPGLSHRRQGRGGGCDRKGRRDHSDLPARAATTLGRGLSDPRQAGARAPRRTDRDRQRHRLARDR